MDGFAFVRAVRSQPGLGGVKLVAVTGLSDRAAIARLLEAGFDGYLVKPLDFDVQSRPVTSRMIRTSKISPSPPLG
jgi:CheY-like chemotaxis protein